MCTVTFIARRHGYALGMNRDEKLTRVAGLPPSRHRLGNRNAVFPSEPNGGTWMGVNDAGATLALINWYSVRACVAGQAISRGQIVKDALAFDSPALVDAALVKSPLARVNPFRLIGAFSKSAAVVEWRWNLERIERLDHPWQTNTWISSGFDEAGAQQTRGKTFAYALRQKSAGRADWLHRLHRSHTPECGPYSHCMHRENAVTVSYTNVTVSGQTATLRYVPGAPCCTAPIADLRLQLSR
jgi:hypothetical protein